MKKTLTTLFLTTVAAFGFAQEQSLSAHVIEKHVLSTTSETEGNGMIYLKMCASGSEIPKNDETVMPGLGVGYRATYDHHAVDLSIEGSRREIRDADGDRTTNLSWTLPRANYLYYVTPKKSSSLYAGGGLAYGGMKQTTPINAIAEEQEKDGTITTLAVAAHDKKQWFYGIIANVSVGYEFGHLIGAKTLIQLDVSQPAIAVSRDGDFFGPKVSLSAGVGF